MRCVIASLAFLLLLSSFSCAEKKDPIAAAIDEVADAAEDRDAKEVMQHLSANFSGASGNRAETELALRRYFFAYRSITIAIRDLQTQRSGPAAFTTFRVDFIGVPKEIGGMDQMLPRTAAYRFEVELREEEGEWKIASAQWRQE